MKVMSEESTAVLLNICARLSGTQQNEKKKTRDEKSRSSLFLIFNLVLNFDLKMIGSFVC